MAKTSDKPLKKVKGPQKRFKGAIDGVPFSKVNQPTPEQKSAGWEQWRKERHFTRSIIDEMCKGENLKTFSAKIKELAEEGNAKAIDVITKALEDDIQKIELTGQGGGPVQIIQLPSNGRDSS